MPELPEVETVRKGLEHTLKGHHFVDITLNREGLRFPFPKNLHSATGKTVLSVERRAKYLLIRLTDDLTILGHLGMSGSINFVIQNQYKPKKHDHVLFSLSNETLMVYNDPRRFGVIDLVQTKEEDNHRLLKHLGPEPLSDDWNANTFAVSIRNRNSSIKTTLLNQKVVVGIGNIYACEALFMSKLSPFCIAKSIAGKKKAGLKAKRLVTSIKTIIQLAIEAGGSTLRDFQDVEGNAGHFSNHFKVYDREGEECLHEGCNAKIKRVVQGGRSTFYCPQCQQ
jgi:formamidopyrimidine-DNA glycosylase